MIVTFSSDVSADVVMFGEVATIFLHAMGEKEQPPGILRGENIRHAAERLRAFVGQVPEEKTGDDGENGNATPDEMHERKNRVGLKKRAFPLLELLDKSYRKSSDVIWR